MYKKIILMLSALIIFSLPYQQQYVEGAIISKVASKGAQKVVKEVIKDIAIESAVSFVVNETFSMLEEEKAKYKAQQEYEVFCGKKMPDLVTCEKPMQVKTALTMTDKDNIGTQSQIELDKLITNGKGFTRWQKFLDWFLPIWVLSFSATALSYAFDSDTRSLFNEAGYNALVALGLIKPVSDTTQSKPLVKEDFPSPTTATGVDTNGTYTKLSSTYNTRYGEIYQTVSPSIENQNQVVTLDFQQNENISGINVMANKIYDGIELKAYTINLDVDIFKSDPMSVILYKNGTHLETKTTPSGNNGTNRYYNLNNTDLPLHFVKINSVIARSPYSVNGFLYYDLLYNTVEGDNYQLQIKTNLASVNIPSMTTGFGTMISANTNQSINPVRVSLFTNQQPFKQILVPQFDEIPEMEYPIDKYTNENGTSLIPPFALPYTQTSTGVQLEPQKNETTGEIEYKAPTGESIPEDDITVGEPVVTPAPSGNPQGLPEGTPQVQPPPTPSNPSPEPIPLTPPQATPTPTPPIETEPPKFPEGESCSEGLKLPKIKPLTQSVTTAFPFSIPFDLYKGFQALFSEIGTEKPSFDLVIGDSIDWKITIPDYFDSWKTFSDGILIFVFDVGLIYAIYRFMSGGGS